MERLPVEIITHILKFLSSLEDRKAASMVCKVWYEAYQSPVIKNREVLEVTSNERFEALTEIRNENLKFVHVVVRGVDITEQNLRFWKRFGPHIKTLSISSCDIREKIFVDVIECCEKLESLSVQNCRELMMTGRLLEYENDRNLLRKRFSRLKVLNLGYNRYLSDAIFVKLTAACENLEELLLPGCHVSFHSGLCRKFYPNVEYRCPSESVLTFPVIFGVISDHMKTLKLLSFNETLINSDAVSRISDLADLSLEQLHLRGCQQLTNDSIFTLSCHQRSLIHLDLEYCRGLTDPSLRTICSELSQLKSLSIRGCRAITDLGISYLWKLMKLNRLNISECEQVRDKGIVQGLGKGLIRSLEELYMSHLPYLSDVSIITVLDCETNLRVLDLGYCCNAVTDASIQRVFSSAKSLTTLILTVCRKLTNRGLTGITLNEVRAELQTDQKQYLRVPLGSKPELMIAGDAKLSQDLARSLKLQEVPQMCVRASLLSLDGSGDSLSNLKHLHTLTLFGCSSISDVSLKLAFTLNELRSLDLSNCQQITSEGLSFVCDNSKSIETLILDNCPNVNDCGVIQIVTKLKRLKTLVLGSPNVTDAVAEWFVVKALKLTYLDVKHCNSLSSVAIERIIKGLPHLATINYCGSNSYDAPHFIPRPPPFTRI